WPGEKSNLLSSDNRDRAALEPLELAERRRTGAEGLILAAQNRAHRVPPFVRILKRSRRFTHRAHCRRMRIKRLHRVKMLNEIEKKLRLVRQIAEGEDAAIHEPLDEPLAKTSHQFAINEAAIKPVRLQVQGRPASS